MPKVAQENSRGVAHAQKAKMRKYWDRYEAEGITFFLLAVDTFGVCHEAGLKTLTKLGRQLATGREEGDNVRHLRQRVAVLLARENMAMLCSRTPTFTTAIANEKSSNSDIILRQYLTCLPLSCIIFHFREVLRLALHNLYRLLPSPLYAPYPIPHTPSLVYWCTVVADSQVEGSTRRRMGQMDAQDQLFRLILSS